MFTKNYIEMVIKADEIQKLCKYKKGDWLLFSDESILVLERDYINEETRHFLNPKWLPTLEDLFGIIKSPYSIAYTLSRIGQEKISAKNIKEKALEIFMEKEYNKLWNGKEWEAINGR